MKMLANISMLTFVAITLIIALSDSKFGGASSHREAPLISLDPLADNTDLFAFRSPDDPSTVTIIAGYIPFQSPEGSPDHVTFGENIRYEIHIDNDASIAGDEIIYYFYFTQENEDPTTFFNVRLGNQNLKTTYRASRSIDGGATFTDIVTGGIVPPNNIGPRSIEGGAGLNTTYDALMQGAIATATTGEKIFCGPVDDPFFVDLGGVFDLGQTRIPGAPGADAARDGVAGFNVHAIALQIPITTLQKDGKDFEFATSILDGDFVIGVWSATSRPAVTVLRSDGQRPDVSGDWVQVSRVGMPLTNEVVIPIGDKDLWNAVGPDTDLQFASYFVNPELALYMDDSQFGGAVPALAPLRIQSNSLGAFDFRNGKDGLFGLPDNALVGTALHSSAFGSILLQDKNPRSVDLLPIFYTGAPNLRPYQLATGKNGDPLAEGKPFINNFLPSLGDKLRLNMAVPPTPRDDPDFSTLGLVQAAVLGLTDPRFNANNALEFIPNMDGFPNGRRLEDDVVTIELQVVSGVFLASIGLWYDDFVSDGSPVTQDLLDVLTYVAGPTKNDMTIKSSFPYLAAPHRGYDYDKQLKFPTSQSSSIQSRFESNSSAHLSALFRAVSSTPSQAQNVLTEQGDLYAFRSPNDPSTVAIATTNIPFELPEGGPNYYTFGENIRYEIHIDNDASIPGDEIIYYFYFTQENEDPTTFFNIRLGAQNLKTTYRAERSIDGGATFTGIVTNGIVPPNNIGPRSISDATIGLGVSSYDALIQGAIMTATTGERVFCGPADDPFFFDLGGFFDLGQTRVPGAAGTEAARDGVAGYNVHVIALQIPISTLQKDGKTADQAADILDGDFVIGVWSATSRRAVTTLRSDGQPPDVSGNWVQVSRVGMPLTNEAIIPIGVKDLWNAVGPDQDLQFASYFTNPELGLYMDASKFGGAVPALSALRIQTASLGAFDFRNGADGLFGLSESARTGTALSDAAFGSILLQDNNPRSIDLLPIFYTGAPNLRPYQLATGKNGDPLAEGKPFINNFLPSLGDKLRLNMAVPPTPRNDPDFSALGLVQAAVLGLTDPRFNVTSDLEFIPNMDGFPNGRRLEDDVATIELQLVSGVLLAEIGFWYDDYTPGLSPSPVTQDLLDVLTYVAGPTKNDLPLKSFFPYLATPHRGYDYMKQLTANGTTVSDPPPAPPQNLRATAADRSVTLAWNANTEIDFLRYRIYGGTTPNPQTKIDSVNGIANTTKIITGMTNGITYYFRITAVDAAFQESGYSNEVSVTPVAVNLPPTAPQNLRVTAGDQRVTLVWNANSEADFLRYRIYQGTIPNPTTKIDSVDGIANTTRVITGLTNGVMYYFRIRAVDTALQQSGYSNEVSATPTLADLPPAAPQSLKASFGDQQVILNWNANIEPDFLRYRIYGGTTINPATQIDSADGILSTTKL